METLGHDHLIPSCVHTFIAGGMMVVSTVAPVVPAQEPYPNWHSLAPMESGFQVGDGFGLSAASDGEITVIGAPDDDRGGTDSGSVAVFDTTTGTELYVIRNPEPQVTGETRFGAAVALSGRTLVVGCPHYRTDAGLAGRAYIFDLSSQTPTQPRLVLNNPSPIELTFFGSAVAVSGTRVVIAPRPRPYTGLPGSELIADRIFVYDLNSPTPSTPSKVIQDPAFITGALNSGFGNSLGLSGALLVVGSSEFGANQSLAGVAYIYDLNDMSQGGPMATLTNPDPSHPDLDSFGARVDVEANLVLVTAPYSELPNGSAGRAYIYDASTSPVNTPITTMENPVAGPFFSAFGLSADIVAGSIVVGDPLARITAPNDPFNTISTGATYIYHHVDGQLDGPPVSCPLPDLAAGGRFGHAVVCSGQAVIVTQPGSGDGWLGAAYAYNIENLEGAAPLVMEHDRGPAGGQNFGGLVSLSGSRLLISKNSFSSLIGPDQRQVLVFDLASESPLVPVMALRKPEQSADRGWDFARSLALSGTRAVVSQVGDRPVRNRFDTIIGFSGSFHIYEIDDPTAEDPRLTVHDPSPSMAVDGFGSVIDIDGSLVVVGDPSETIVPDGFGGFFATNGAVYVFDLDAPNPALPVRTLLPPELGQASSGFGIEVAISGQRIVVGAPAALAAQGVVYVFDLSSNDPGTPIVTLMDPLPAEGNRFGSSVDISGTRVVVGVPFDDAGGSDAGCAYAFELSGALPGVSSVQLVNPDSTPGGLFGFSVSISGDRAVVGAPLYHGYPGEARAYIYDLAADVPGSSLAQLRHPWPGLTNGFGFAVAIDGPLAAVGNPGESWTMAGIGKVAVFRSLESDLDNDRLPDIWEEQYFETFSRSHSSDDPDADGQSNLDELIARTNPARGDDSFGARIATSGDGLILTFEGAMNRTYTLERSSNLQTWDDAGLAPLAGAGAPASFSFVPPWQETWYYRIRVRPMP
jgi:hypothetical protein